MCFSDTFPLNVLNTFEMWLPFFQIRSCPHLQENSSGRKVKQLFIRASIQTQGACAETSLPQGGCPALLCCRRSDKASGWTDKTAGNEDYPGCSSCLPHMAGACKCYCSSTALCIRWQSKVEEHQWNIKSSFGITLLSDLIEATDVLWRTCVLFY